MSGNISYSEYWAEVRSLAVQVEEAVSSGDAEVDAWTDYLWETIDGHQWVIYTAYNFDVLKHSQNDGYAVDNWGAEAAVQDGQVNWASLAFGALYADVCEAVDVDNFDTAESYDDAEEDQA